MGPFHKYGSGLVAACAENGTSYVDITGESPWVAEMIAAHDDKARETGAIIVPMCGFDSIPSDIGTYWVSARHAPRLPPPAQPQHCPLMLHNQCIRWCNKCARRTRQAPRVSRTWCACVVEPRVVPSTLAWRSQRTWCRGLHSFTAWCWLLSASMTAHSPRIPQQQKVRRGDEPAPAPLLWH